MAGLRGVVRLVQVAALLAAVATVVALAVYRGPGAPAGDVTLGEHVYETTCVSCHGPLGEGRIGPRIGGGAAVRAYPGRADMLRLVGDGRNRMPGFTGTLTPGEIGAVVDYVRNELPREP